MSTTTKKKVVRRAKRAKAGAKAAGQGAASTLRQRWNEAWQGLTAAEAQVEKRLGSLLKANGISSKDVGKALQELAERFEKERRRAVREVESRLEGLQERVGRERKAVGRLVDDAVRGALVTLNIPTRREVMQLTRKVDELARRLDRKARAAARPRARRARTSRAA